MGEHADEPLRRAHRPLAARGERLVELRALLVGHDAGRAVDDVGDRAHAVAVIGDHVEVERTRELYGLARVRGHLLAAREAVGVARRVARALAAGVEGERGVDVGVAEVDVGGKLSIRVRRIRPAPERVLEALEVGRVLRCARPGRCDQNGDGGRRACHSGPLRAMRGPLGASRSRREQGV